MPTESFPVDRIERMLRQQLGIVLSPLRAIDLLRTLLLPLALVASLLLALPALSAAENTISGTVSLPDGRTATEDMYVDVSAMTEDAIGFASTTAHIAAGEREGTYTLTVESDSSALWRVYYNYYGSEPYLNFGYYSPAGTKTLWDDTSLLTGGQDHADIKLTLLASNTISGTVSLPTGRTATEGMYVTVYVQTEDYSESNSATTYIASGASDATYTLTIPSAVNASWHVYYSYSGSEPYLRIGYYSTVGTQPWTNQATLLPAGTDHSDINLVLLTGNTISGTVFLPDGRTATEDMYVSVSAQTSDYSASASATAFIPAGASDGTYTLTISPDTNVSWQVYYSYWGGEAYQHWGYYNDIVGTLTMPEQATLLQGGQDHSGITLTLLINYTISGTVSLPEGHKAPDGGLKVSVMLWDENFGYGDEFVIPAGESSVGYSLGMPSDTTVSKRIGYSLGWWTTGAYLERGYYSTAGTQWQLAQATPLAGGAVYSDINLTLLTGSTISGTVSLPGGRKAPAGGLAVQVNARDTVNSLQHNSVSVIIPENNSSAPYAIAVQPDPSASWEISCSEEGDDDTYLPGYYNTAGTTWFWEWATLMPGGADRSGINLTLLVGKTISGILSLPAGQKAPTGGLSIEVILDTDILIDGAYHWTTVTIAEGEASAPYTFTVPDDPETFWHVWYYLNDPPTGNYLYKGYYNSSGTQWREELATLLPGMDHASINLPLLVGNTISGTVSLPDGLTAPEDGLYVTVNARNQTSYNYNDSRTVFIPAGGKSTDYDVPVPVDADVSWEILYSFYPAEGTELARCLQEGYHSTSGTQWRADLATLVSGGANRTGIDLALLLGKTISGTVSRPSGLPTNYEVSLTISAANGFNSSYDDVVIAVGASGAAFTMTVPADDTQMWIVEYEGDIRYSTGGNQDNYLSNGYYSINGTQWRSTLATPIAGGADRTGIDLILLVGGNTISGTVSLPNDVPEIPGYTGTLTIVVSEQNAPDKPVFSSGIGLPFSGSRSATFALPVPADANVSWIVSYDFWMGNWHGVIEYGYYSTSGTQWRPSLADPLTGGQNHPGIDLVLLQPTTVSGTVSLPSGQIAPAGGLGLLVEVAEQADPEFRAGVQYVTVPGGKASTAYSVLVPIDASAFWAVRYSYEGSGDYLPQGYFSSAGTQANLAQATFLSGSAPLTGVHLTLLVDQAVNPDTDADLLPDAWEMTHFGNLTTADGTTDYDRDGYTDLQEYLNEEQGETDPLGAEYDPKQGNAPGGTGYISISNDEGFWEIMTPVIINSAREAAGR